MNRTILLTAAALAVAFVQPGQAWARGGGGDSHSGGGRGGAGGGAAFRAGGGSSRGGGGASMHVSQAPHFASHVQAMPRAATQAQSFALRQPTQPARTFSRPNNSNATVNNRTFNGANRQSPSIAFGGSAPMSRDAEVQPNRSFNGTADTRNFSRPSTEVTRDWDRRQIHTWNHHRFRWFNNNWVIIDGGFGFGYPYYYGYAPYDDYGYDATPYDDSTTALPYERSTTDSLASAVQEELVRKGYNPGAVDGVIGPQTRNAIAQFQSDHHLPVTGRIDRSLMSAMNL